MQSNMPKSTIPEIDPTGSADEAIRMESLAFPTHTCNPSVNTSNARVCMYGVSI